MPTIQELKAEMAKLEDEQMEIQGKLVHYRALEDQLDQKASQIEMELSVVRRDKERAYTSLVAQKRKISVLSQQITKMGKGRT